MKWMLYLILTETCDLICRDLSNIKKVTWTYRNCPIKLEMNVWHIFPDYF